MENPQLALKRVTYAHLNSRQQENFNFAKVSAVLADYGYVTLRLSDDWQGADFIAHHVSGERFLKVQLKGRLFVDTKYKDKEIWICFRSRPEEKWYLIPHDAFLHWALSNLRIGRTKGWSNVDDWTRVKGAYSWPGIPKQAAAWLAPYAL